MSKKYIASLTSSLAPKLASVEVVYESKKYILTRNVVSLAGNYRPPSRMYLKQYHVFDTLEGAKLFLVETAQEKVEKLKNDLERISI